MAADKAEELPYSPLTRLNEEACEPNLCSNRLDYKMHMNKGDYTYMTEQKLSAVAKLFPWPKGVKLGLPRCGGGSQAKYRGCIVIYEEALKAGFRLPLHPVISKFLAEINLCPSQLTPNSWRCILAFLLKCKEFGRVPPYDALKNLFAIKPAQYHSGVYDIYFPTVNLITIPPSNDISWSTRWFLVFESEEFQFNFRRYPGNLQKIADFSCSTETLKFIETLKRLPHPGPDYNEVLDPCRLEEAGLSLPHPITVPSDADWNSSDTMAPVDKADELPYSRLICLNRKAHKPEVSSHRVRYVKGSNQGDKFSRSHMIEMDLLAVAEFFPWPKGVRLSLPCSNGGSEARYPGCIVIYEEALKAGFRLPLHPVISKFLCEINLCPSQLTPNSWRCIVAFILKCKELDLVPPYDALKNIYNYTPFLSFGYDMHFPYVNLISNPIYYDRLWENRWFLVSSSEEFCFNFPMYPGRIRVMRVSCEEETLKFIQTLRQLPCPAPVYTEVLDALRLEEAGLSLPHPITGPGSLDDQYKEYIGKRKREIEMDRVSKKAKTCCTSQPNDNELPEELDDDTPNESIHVDLENEPSPEELNDDTPNESIHVDLEKEPSPEELDDDTPNESIHVDLEKEPSPEELDDDTPNESIHVDLEKEPSREGGIDVLPDSVGAKAIDTLCHPEFITALQRLPDIIKAAKHSEELQRQLDESEREIVALKREKAELKSQKVEIMQENVELKRREMQFVNDLARKEREFQSRIKSMELGKKSVEEQLRASQIKLLDTTRKAKELFEISSSPLSIKR